jgi:hypothetical protein
MVAVMAHFAKINDENIVEQVILVSNDDAPNEKAGKKFIANLGIEGIWIQTSYNNSIRGKFAGIGDTYNQDQDVFISAVYEIIDETTTK